MSQKFEKLKTLLKELFQLDKPDLDFGIYRILHARAAEVSQFLDRDLLPQVQAAFAGYRTADKVALERELAEAEQQARNLGADPDQLPKVQQLRQRLKSDAVDVGALESEVYDHLYSFFRRYYSEGDFLSKRVYKPGVYAIPYEGEEVKLHWANADQYYIKTSEYLRDYAFRLRPEDQARPMRVHFRLQDAAEGEHGNVKEAEGKERRFILADTPPTIENGELIILFDYRPDGDAAEIAADVNSEAPDDEKSVPSRKRRARAQRDINAQTEVRLLTLAEPALAEWFAELGKPHIRSDGTTSESTRLRVHLDRYTARNTFDYFIHKDLGGFLRRELDFYIKNEVMHLDDIESDTAPRVEQYLSKIKVMRRIAGKIITFLSQIEDFQKKLWLKKKFVTQTSWCIALSAIPEEFHPEVAANDAQREEWVRLHAIDQITPPSPQAGYSIPLTTAFLRAHPTLMVDTTHLAATTTERILSAIAEADKSTNAILVHSENFQALSLMRPRLKTTNNFIYIDPPYNTGTDEFIYKDNYQHSSWLSLISDRILLTKEIMSPESVLACSLNDDESFRMRVLSYSWGPSLNCVGEFVWKTRNTDNRITSRFSVDHDYIHVFASSSGRIAGRVVDRSSFRNPDSDPRGAYTTDPLTGKANASERPNLHYPITNEATGDVYQPDPDSGWITDKAGFAALLKDNRIYWPTNPQTGKPRKKRFLFEAAERAPVSSLSISIEQGEGNRDLQNKFGSKPMNFPKPISVIKTVINYCSPESANIIDFFAGSGTTGDAVIEANREDGGKRTFVLIEGANHFDSVMLPRIKKAAFAPVWSEGRPTRLATAEEAANSPRIFKILRLEGYEDTLNNLDLGRSAQMQTLLDHTEAQGPDGLREQYLLRYMLDVESRCSASLLDIEAFTDPTGYRLRVKRPGSDESREVCVDLIETFNWLLGLTVAHYAAPQSFAAVFRPDEEGRLSLDGRLRLDPNGPFWFRTVTGTTPEGRKTLVIWRKLTGNAAQDNLVLDEWFTRQGYSSKDSEFDLIYVNGDNNLENLKAADDLWKVRLIEEDFHRLMFAEEG